MHQRCSIECANQRQQQDGGPAAHNADSLNDRSNGGKGDAARDCAKAREGKKSPTPGWLLPLESTDWKVRKQGR